MEGRHIQIQGHSLPLLQERKCKQECKLPARSSLLCANRDQLTILLLANLTALFTLISQPPIKKAEMEPRVELFVCVLIPEE